MIGIISYTEYLFLMMHNDNKYKMEIIVMVNNSDSL